MDFAQIAANVVSQANGEPMSKPKVKDRDFSVIARNVVEAAIHEHLDGSPLPPVHEVTAAQTPGSSGRPKGW